MHVDKHISIRFRAHVFRFSITKEIMNKVKRSFSLVQRLKAHSQALQTMESRNDQRIFNF